jgi:hypothetical protein
LNSTLDKLPFQGLILGMARSTAPTLPSCSRERLPISERCVSRSTHVAIYVCAASDESTFVGREPRLSARLCTAGLATGSTMKAPARALT